MCGQIAKSKFMACLFVVAALATGASSSANAKARDWQSTLDPGYKLLTEGEIEKSADFFAKKVQKYPQSGACHTAYGKALKRLGKFSQAKSEFSAATTVESSYPDGFYELGIALENDKQYAAAAEAFSRFATLSPDEAARKNVADRVRFCADHTDQKG